MVLAMLLVTPHGHAAAHPILLVREILTLGSTGALTYVATHLGIWLAMGRPNGPESEVGRVLDILMRRLRPSAAVAH
jgi:hypothetical protein